MESAEAKSHGEVPHEVHAKEEEENVQVENGAWESICEILRAHVGVDAFQRWFNSASWSGIDAGVATVTVPGEIMRRFAVVRLDPEGLIKVPAQNSPYFSHRGKHEL